ncbi:MAG: DNA-directed RNA polymerase subunit alpha [Candidatus Omnitrophota bacterium]
MEQFEYPKKIEWEKDTYRQNYGKIMVAPLERGYATTIGNTLRRVLLSSISGVAITSVKIDGVAHEFSAVSGVKEDVTDIILNLKQVNLKSNITDLPKTFPVTIKDKNEILAGDLFPGPEIEVLNSNLHIATLSEGTQIRMELAVGKSFGYVPVSRMNQEGVPIGTILMAVSFSPVTRVSYRTENTRVGQRVDYEKLIMEIWTTGAVSPKEAITFATGILQKHFTLIAGEKDVATGDNLLEKTLDGFLPARIANVLKSSNIVTVKNLLSCSKKKLEEIPRLGDKSRDEIYRFLEANKLCVTEGGKG